MSNSYFQFKQFKIHQDKCAMKVGTDGVLLGAWADAGSAKRILDIGTGTGLLALMLAQKSDAGIHAIEIDEDACAQAQQNFLESRWKERLTLQHISFQDFIVKNNKSFDLVVANPPYFDKAYKPTDSSRSAARHSDSLSLQELTETEKLLAAGGRLVLILPVEPAKKFIALATLHLNKLCEVKPTPGKASVRWLMEFSLSNNPLIKEELIIENKRHEYTNEYVALTKDYYLYF